MSTRLARHSLPLLAAVTLLAALMPAAEGQLYSAASGLLPEQSCPDWNALVDSGASATVSGSSLVLDTNTCAERASYSLVSPDITVPAPVWFEARLRIVSGSSCSSARRTVVMAVSTQPGTGQLVQIGPGELMTTASNGPGTDYVSAQHFLDTSVFRTYRVTIDALGITEVRVDGVLVITTSVSSNNTSNHGTAPRVSWGNGSVFSYGRSEWQYVDSNVVRNLAVEGIQAMPGAPLFIRNEGMIPGREYYNLLSVEICPGGPGTGIYLGLCASTAPAVQFLIDQLLLPLGSVPIHFQAPDFCTDWGPFALPPLTLDVVCFDFTGGVLGAVSPVSRMVIL